jgi:HemK-related putative methylase
MGDADSGDDNDDRPSLAEQRGVDGHVYQPAEDSALLARAAIDDMTAPEHVLEVGTGSGWVAEQVADETDARVVGSDLNPHACRQARERGVGAVRADLVAPFAADGFDAVLFNPPYLPTDPDNEWGDWMEHALSGGTDGRRLIVPFLGDVGRVLQPDGAVYLLVSSLTGYEIVVDLAEEAGFATAEVAQESYPFEVLSVLRLSQ